MPRQDNRRETGVREYKIDKRPGPGDAFSQDAAENKPPKGGYGLTEPVDETEAHARHSEGVEPRRAASAGEETSSQEHAMTERNENADPRRERPRTMNPDTAHERHKANPDVGDVQDPDNVWADAETTPQRDRPLPKRPGGGDRVADAGDVGSGSTSPYGLDTQADQVGGQTKRGNERKPSGR